MQERHLVERGLVDWRTPFLCSAPVSDDAARREKEIVELLLSERRVFQQLGEGCWVVARAEAALAE